MAGVFPHQSVTGWLVALTIIDIISILGTFFRIGLRYRTSKLWWDDAAALIPTGSLITLLCVMYDTQILQSTVRAFKDPFGPDAAAGQFQNHWTSSFLFLTCVWGGRISLSIGLLRIFPSWSRSRTVAWSLTGLFALFYVFLVVFYPAACRDSVAGTKMDLFVKCLSTSNGVPVAATLSLILNYVGDFLLVACPLYMLWGLKLPPSEHRLILVLFSSSIITFLIVIIFTAVFHAPVSVFTVDKLIMGYGISHLESSVSLIVCNLMVIAGFFYRMYRSGKQQTIVYLSGDGGSATRKIATAPTHSSGTTHVVTKSITIEVAADDSDYTTSKDRDIGIPLAALSHRRGDERGELSKRGHENL